MPNLRFRVAIAAVVGMLLLPGISAGQCTNPTEFETRYASFANACSDGVDNDGDGLTDSADPGCLVETRFSVSCNSLCGDGYDNDGDGTIDTLDGSCTVETRFGSGATLWYDACADGYDNDGDTYIDEYPYGTSGSGGRDPNCLVETNWGLFNACTDGFNNDNDSSNNLGTDVQLIDKAPPVGAVADPECLGEILCTDGIDNDTDGAIDGSDLDCQCMDDNISPVNCTANDFTIAFTVDPEEIEDGCINTSDYVTITSLQAGLTSAVPERQDLGMWINLEGQSAKGFGLCMRQMLTPVRFAGTFASIIQPPGPYRTFENSTGQGTANRDYCGDVGNSTGAVWRYQVPVTLPCTDTLVSPVNNGYLDLGQCGSWDNNDKQFCTSVSGALPNTSSKCDCADADTSVPAPNLRTTCSLAWTPSVTGGNAALPLDPGETATYQLGLTNTVANCTPGTTIDTVNDPFGQRRCGTVSFMRFQIDYNTGGVDASLYGSFYVESALGVWSAVPACTTTVNTYQGLVGGTGVICDDTVNDRLIWAPQDPVDADGAGSPAYGVISAFPTTNGPLILNFRYLKNGVPASGTISFVAEILWDRELDIAPENSLISSAEAVTVGPFSKLQSTCTDCGCASSLGTTPVTLAAAGATRHGASVRFVWTTETEVENVGFNIYGRTAAGWRRLNDALIPAVGGGIEPQRYEVTLAVPAGVTEFYIEDVDRNGNATPHRVFHAGDDGRTPLDAGEVAAAGAAGEQASSAALGHS